MSTHNICFHGEIRKISTIFCQKMCYPELRAKPLTVSTLKFERIHLILGGGRGGVFKKRWRKRGKTIILLVKSDQMAPLGRFDQGLQCLLWPTCPNI